MGETIFEAGRREVREETGLEISQFEHLAVVDMIEFDDAGGVRYHYTLVDLLATSKEQMVCPGGDAAGALWVTLDEALNLPLWSETKKIIELARGRLGV